MSNDFWQFEGADLLDPLSTRFL